VDKINKVKIIVIILIVAFFFNEGISQTPKSEDVAIILKTKGDVKVKKEEEQKWFKGTRGIRLDSGDIVKTYEKSLAAIMFTDDKSLLKVRDNAALAIRGKRLKTTMTKRIVCSMGNFWLKVTQQKSKVLVETPSGIAAVKGTEFYGVVDENGNTMIIVIEGIVQLINKLGEALVEAGQTGIMSKGLPPKVFKTDSSQKMKWADEDKITKELEFEFQDGNGNKKYLKIIYH